MVGGDTYERVPLFVRPQVYDVIDDVHRKSKTDIKISSLQKFRRIELRLL